MTSPKKISYYIGISILSIALFVLIALLAAFGFDYKIIIGSIIYFTATYLSLKFIRFSKPLTTFWIIILPIVLIIIFFNVLQFNSTLVSAPSNIFLLLSCVTAYFFYKSKNYLFPVLFFGLFLVWQFQGKKWLHNYISYGNTSGKVNEIMHSTILFDAKGNIATIPSLNKITILDFWNSTCSPCYELFPYIDSIGKKIDTSKFDIFAVNVPVMQEEKEDNYKLLDRFNYSFKQAFAINASIIDSFNIKVYPTTIVVKENRILFRGDFAEAVKFVGIN